MKRWGPERVEAACARALDAEVVSVPLIGRMIERATETKTADPPTTAEPRPARFAREAEHFAVGRSTRGQELLDADGGAA